ncbi:succinate dehydrogenase, hydrophobic membrane anchor protein [Reyranella sp. CPCC 100927]|uniref:succinate dehydrogenase, hydrophobic membrane anchor protein n=1 Tax=Reyranella sp. CPCC 100927 TaxID=2599616 RepID=UPI0011B43EEC|nr:succinate dehydrogenase, hydrophobic membrane anchor protein [Reyranella sp. CPCC 100927]TWT15634.1 succinate dehydrogenase, hydrophobic membrane anchor protein [Reyranella sp. CPCC 100927]
MADLRSPLARVRGLGSAQDGTHHWWLQRVTAIALVPLVVWFIISMLRVAPEGQAAVRAWIASPITMTMLILFIAVGLWHAALGMQVVIEDYVHTKGWRIGLDLAVKFIAAALIVAGIVAIFKIAFGG